MCANLFIISEGFNNTHKSLIEWMLYIEIMAIILGIITFFFCDIISHLVVDLFGVRKISIS